METQTAHKRLIWLILRKTWTAGKWNVTRKITSWNAINTLKSFATACKNINKDRKWIWQNKNFMQVVVLLMIFDRFRAFTYHFMPLRRKQTQDKVRNNFLRHKIAVNCKWSKKPPFHHKWYPPNMLNLVCREDETKLCTYVSDHCAENSDSFSFASMTLTTKIQKKVHFRCVHVQHSDFYIQVTTALSNLQLVSNKVVEVRVMIIPFQCKTHPIK